jgi:hypothetical protein
MLSLDSSLSISATVIISEQKEIKKDSKKEKAAKYRIRYLCPKSWKILGYLSL